VTWNVEAEVPTHIAGLVYSKWLSSGSSCPWVIHFWQCAQNLTNYRQKCFVICYYFLGWSSQIATSTNWSKEAHTMKVHSMASTIQWKRVMCPMCGIYAIASETICLAFSAKWSPWWEDYIIHMKILEIVPTGARYHQSCSFWDVLTGLYNAPRCCISFTEFWPQRNTFTMRLMTCTKYGMHVETRSMATATLQMGFTSSYIVVSLLVALLVVK